MYKKIFSIFILVLCVSQMESFAEDHFFESKLDTHEIEVGKATYLRLRFHGAQDLSKPDLKEPDGLNVRYVGPSRRMILRNGERKESVEHVFQLIALEAGEYAIGPFTVSYEEKEYLAEALELIVNEKAPKEELEFADEPSEAENERKPYVSEKAFLQLELNRRTFYASDQIEVVIKLYVSDVVLDKIEYPTIEHEGFKAGRMQKRPRTREVINDEVYTVLAFSIDLKAEKEGEYMIGPASLNCNMLVPEEKRSGLSFFGTRFFDDIFLRDSFKSYPIKLETFEMPVKILPRSEKKRYELFEGKMAYLSRIFY